MEITDAACPSVMSVVVSSDRQVALTGTDILLVLSDHLQASSPYADSTQRHDGLSIKNTFPGFPCFPPRSFEPAFSSLYAAVRYRYTNPRLLLPGV